METERPPSGGDGADAYSAATVVRSLPDDLLVQMAALKQQKLPKIEGAVRVDEEDTERFDAEDTERLEPPKRDTSVETSESAGEAAADAETLPKQPQKSAREEEARAADAPRTGASAALPDEGESSERPPPPRKGTRSSHTSIEVDRAPPSSGSSTMIVALVVAAVAIAVAAYFATR
jgi:hypothetical protein